MADIIDIERFKKSKAEEEDWLQATKDISAYEDMVMRSVQSFHTYSVQEKQALYSSLALFNIELLKILHEGEEKTVE